MSLRWLVRLQPSSFFFWGWGFAFAATASSALCCRSQARRRYCASSCYMCFICCCSLYSVSI
ncbi:hypothetical protein PF005_g17521 [Phytophthora fragariae]|uniref:Uncharacterized protein n=1 Tax=Phytophthora fragariae TaxID=53985 RepID=A0A6A3ELN8_9STRA|nr:hypothetical protein PF003_g32092 [Phytophthora fragariae]KAE8931008.1 hypothetical protein PF009_g18916 [Phytophthora fragariae]KAE9086747.1 hypothetical protein PF010_g19974 [Phytophthora fragariae]KAE9090239.1 hypothetical protein PF007_g19316 [Phytophthora fragariae]KAE9126978.1 hypothetical protein PF006_g16610 [Phytophthora fragariae]